MFDDKGGEMYPKSKQVMPLARGRNGKCNAKGCMVIGGGGGMENAMQKDAW